MKKKTAKKKATKKKTAAKKKATKKKAAAGIWAVELRAKPCDPWRLTFMGRGFWETRPQAYAEASAIRETSIFDTRVRRYTP